MGRFYAKGFTIFRPVTSNQFFVYRNAIFNHCADVGITVHNPPLSVLIRYGRHQQLPVC